jgi:two-component system LytT family response regulator
MKQAGELRVVVVEDEVVSRDGLVRLIERDADLRCVAAVGDVSGATEAIRSLAPDIVVLDVGLGDGTGFDVLRKVEGPRTPVVVFVTAFNDFAVDAFDACALDYVVKPFADARFEKAMARSKQVCRDAESARVGQSVVRLVAMEAPAPAVEPPLTRLAIKHGSKVLFVPVDDIDWIEADDYYAAIHARGRRHLIRESLASLEQRLDASRFVRAHRSAIVNIDRVRELRSAHESTGETVLVLRDGTRVPISRRRREQVAAALRRLGD